MSETDSTAKTDEPESADDNPSPSFEIHSLRPEYVPASHDLYVGYLRQELNKPARQKKERGAEPLDSELRPRNLALTGSYGSGKSSILEKIVDEFGDRVVSVSLSTLGSEEGPLEDDEARDPLKTPRITNAIQKEIVKQLLYREKPSNVPGSRYRRIEGFRKGRAFGFSLLIAAALSAIAFLTGSTLRVEKLLGNELGTNVLIYVVLFALLVVISQGVQALFSNRVWIEKLTSGPASISLTNKSESFFDKYLDEIVYFFEANSYDIVVFEDLDRFNDPYIFETLRELNTLLNNSKQIDPSVITFVYAIKDSIFEQLGQLSINGVKLTDEEVRQLAVTNRTKFFDVVIPVVPFISHRNARDLLSKEMKSSGFQIDKRLLDLIAKHMVDMRLIKNVHNEFGVFQQKILGPDRLEELKAQPLFAMVVYKNLNMGDFEKVKQGDSHLDDVYADFRLLVNQQISSADSAIRNAQRRLRKLDSVEKRSRTLGDQLEEYLDRLLRHLGQKISAATLTLSAGISLADLRESQFWRTWLNDEALDLIVNYQTTVNVSYYGQQAVTQTVTVTLNDVRVALRDSISLEEWQAEDAKSLHASVEENAQLRTFLKSATMQQLAERSDLVLQSNHGAESFAAMAERHLGKGLALDLVAAGYIDRNFSLYVSLYYDETVTARARNFILHAVEANAMDANAQIGTGPEIEAMLDEAGEAIFSSKSIFNIQLMDHLLAKGDDRIDRSMRLMAADGLQEREFRAAYFSNGTQLEAFVLRLSPLWTDVFTFLASDESVPDEQRADLVDAALSAMSSKLVYGTDADLSEFFGTNHRALATLVGTRPVSSSEAVVTLLKSAEVRFPSLEAVAEALRPGAVSESLYELTEENLTVALGGAKNLSLDKVRSINEAVFRFLVQNIKTYVEIQHGSDATAHTIDDHKNFVSVMNELVINDVEDLIPIVEGASSVVVTKITALNEKLWPLIAKTRRLQSNYVNVVKYIDRMGGVDDGLVATLNASQSISDLEAADEPGKRALALAIIGNKTIRDDKRVGLIKSLELASPLLVSELSLSDDNPVVANLLVADNLIEDSVDSFVALGDASWPVKQAFISGSTKFSTYVGDIDFSRSDFASLCQDESLDDAIKREVVLNLTAFADSSTKAALDPLAQFAIDTDIAIGPANLLALATAGVSTDKLILLVTSEMTSLTLNELLAVLSAMPDRYRKLTTTGGHTKIPNTPADLQLADYLVNLGQVSSRDPSPSGSVFRVNLKRRV